jgi:hypothetical protein
MPVRRHCERDEPVDESSSPIALMGYNVSANPNGWLRRRME